MDSVGLVPPAPWRVACQIVVFAVADHNNNNNNNNNKDICIAP